MSSIGSMIPLANAIIWRGPRERPAPVEKPSRGTGTDTGSGWASRSDDSSAARQATILTKLAQGPNSALLDARLSGALHNLRPTPRPGAHTPDPARPATARVDRLEVLGTAAFASPDEPLGDDAVGSFFLNGSRVDVGADDTLRSLQEQINALAAGAAGSAVRAATVTGGAGEHRLALFNEAADSRSIELVDGSADGPLSRLGMVGREMLANHGESGEAESSRFSSAKLAIASLLGVVTYPPPATMKVNGRTVAVDLSVDSLTSIAARVLAEARAEASVREEEAGDSRHYRLVVDGEVEPATPDDDFVASLVGFVRPRTPSLPSLQPHPGTERETAWEAGIAPHAGSSRETGAPSRERRAAHDVMLQRFAAIDATMSRIREQAAPLVVELRALEPEPESA